MSLSVEVLGSRYANKGECLITRRDATRNDTEDVPMEDMIVLFCQFSQADSGDCLDSFVVLQFPESFGLISLAANPNCILYMPVSSVHARYVSLSA